MRVHYPIHSSLPDMRFPFGESVAGPYPFWLPYMLLICSSHSFQEHRPRVIIRQAKIQPELAIMDCANRSCTSLTVNKFDGYRVLSSAPHFLMKDCCKRLQNVTPWHRKNAHVVWSLSQGMAPRYTSILLPGQSTSRLSCHYLSSIVSGYAHTLINHGSIPPRPPIAPRSSAV